MGGWDDLSQYLLSVTIVILYLLALNMREYEIRLNHGCTPSLIKDACKIVLKIFFFFFFFLKIVLKIIIYD